MLRLILAAVPAVVFTFSAAAQDQGLPPWPGQPKPGEPTPLSVRVKLEWICNQLNLTDEQWKHVEGLFAIVDVNAKPPADEMRDLMTQIRELAGLIQAADAAGETERANELRAQLKALAPGVKAQQDFIAGLTPKLTDEQKTKLDQILKRLENVKYLEQLQLKPIQVVRIARGLQLSPEQQQRLEQVMSAFRKHVEKLGPIKPTQQSELLDIIIADVGALLDPAQKPQFQSQIDKLRIRAPARG